MSAFFHRIYPDRTSEHDSTSCPDMKKLYQQQRWKHHSCRRAKSELKKRRRQALANLGPLSHEPQYKQQRRAGRRVEIVAPELFSVLENTEEMLFFFAAIDKHIQARRTITMNLTGVKTITTDAIAYTLSLLEFARNNGFPAAIRGTSPSDPECNEILRASGFYDYVYYQGVSVVVNRPEIYSIKSGILVDPILAAELKSFARERLSRPESRDMKQLYRIIIECMANTRNHAYSGMTRKPYKWWVMASYNVRRKAVTFTFIDNGAGIPATVRRKRLERALAVIGPESRRRRLDHELIVSALRGEFRTSTNLEYRGKGLPSILRASDEGTICNLRMLSRYGMLKWESQSHYRLKNPFRGTVIAWEVRALV